MSKSPHSSDRVTNRAFRVDWGRVVEKSRFQRVVLKAANGDESEVEQVKMVGVNVVAKVGVQQWRGADTGCGSR